jgi:hypothetical protein
MGNSSASDDAAMRSGVGRLFTISSSVVTLVFFASDAAGDGPESCLPPPLISCPRSSEPTPTTARCTRSTSEPGLP